MSAVSLCPDKRSAAVKWNREVPIGVVRAAMTSRWAQRVLRVRPGVRDAAHVIDARR
jgi:hypothetical protein